MRIALFHNLPSGGAKRFVFEQVRELARRGRMGSRLRLSGKLALALVIMLAAIGLRLWSLGNTFHSSDYAELPARVLVNTGYRWMLQEPYGLLIAPTVKLCIGVLTYLGVTITEFWWKAPIAFLGVLHVLLTFILLRRLNCSWLSAALGACFIAVLPIHIMQSRYTWGYEELGLFSSLAFSCSSYLFSRSQRSGEGLLRQ